MDMLRFFGLDAKVIVRKNSFVVYMKEGNNITDTLNLMGAVVSQMNLYNVMILKEMRNDVNRKVNCETANLNKTISAAVKQTRDIEYINILSSKGVDGILYCMSSDSDDVFAQESCDLMNRLNIPFIMVDRTSATLDCSSVVLDHFNGGYIATKHLIDLGHKRIACITGPKLLYDSHQRLEGYKLALSQAGISYDENIVYKGDYTTNSGYHAANYLLDKEITSIFCFNDMMAYGVYKALKDKNLNMPNDISVVGYDDVFLSDMFEVPLTSVKQPIYEMGEEATYNLINIIENKGGKKRVVVFKPEIVVRKSTSKLIESDLSR